MAKEPAELKPGAYRPHEGEWSLGQGGGCPWLGPFPSFSPPHTSHPGWSQAVSFQSDMRLPDCRTGSSCSLPNPGPGPEQQLSRSAEWVPAGADHESPGQQKQSPDFRRPCFKETSALFPDLFWVLRPSGKRDGREEGLEWGTDHPAARCQ